MRYRLRTLLILLAVLPPVLAVGWGRYSAWQAERERQAAEARAIVARNGPKIGWMFGPPDPYYGPFIRIPSYVGISGDLANDEDRPMCD